MFKKSNEIYEMNDNSQITNVKLLNKYYNLMEKNAF